MCVLVMADHVTVLAGRVSLSEIGYEICAAG